MAHNIETTAWAGETPWHGLGKKVHHDLTPSQMCTEAELDWSVSKIPAFTEVEVMENDEKKIKRLDTGKSALVRDSDHRVLSVIGNDWEPVQNSDAFQFFHDFVMAGDMEMHTAGSLFGGEIVWVLAKIKESFKIFGNDEVQSFLLFSNPHQYGKSVDIRFTPTRVVCWNTLSMALKGNADITYKMNHRKTFDAEIAKKTMGLAHQKFEGYQEMAEFLGSKKYKHSDVVKYFNDVFPTNSVDADGSPKLSRNARRAVEYLETQPGAEYGAGTWWSAVNAVTFMTNHVVGHNPTSRLESAWYGANRRLNLNAFEKAVEYAEAV